MHAGARSSGLWMWLNIAIILVSAAIILYPPVRHFWVFIIAFSFVLVPVYFFLLIRRMKREGTGNIPLSELHAQVKGGRRLPTSALEWAAAAALLLSSIYSLMSGG
jgi:hypothetical protein